MPLYSSHIFISTNVAFIYCMSTHTFSYSGLVSFWVAREMNGKNGSRKWIDRAIECKDEFVKLSVSASTWNFENSECQISTSSLLSYLSHLSILRLVLFSLISSTIFTAFTESFLLQAEEHFCRRNFELAETLYDAAISSSKIHKFVNEEALANELAGHFYLETGRRNRSVQYFSQAFEKYNEWGAVAKASTLTEYLDESER